MTGLLHDIITQLSTLTEDELCMLNSAVVAEVKSKRAMQAQWVKASLTVGDTVEWSGRAGFQRGKLIKINRKNAKVEVGNTTWTVPLTMLKRVS